MAGKTSREGHRIAASSYATKPECLDGSGMGGEVGETQPKYDASAEYDETVGMSASFDDWCEAQGPAAAKRVSDILKRYEDEDEDQRTGGMLDPEAIWERIYGSHESAPGGEACLSLGAPMASARKTITVTRQQDEWIKMKIATGDFTDDSEYIRDLIRLDQARHSETEYIRSELVRGEQSGEPEPFDLDGFRQAMASAHANARR